MDQKCQVTISEVDGGTGRRLGRIWGKMQHRSWCSYSIICGRKKTITVWPIQFTSTLRQFTRTVSITQLIPIDQGGDSKNEICQRYINITLKWAFVRGLFFYLHRSYLNSKVMGTRRISTYVDLTSTLNKCERETVSKCVNTTSSISKNLARIVETTGFIGWKIFQLANFPVSV